MSVSYLLEAVRDHLRSELQLADDQCDVTPGGRPTPASGQLFVGVDDAGSENSTTQYLSETVSVDVFVSIRAGDVPTDRKGRVIYLANSRSINSLCDRVRLALSGKYEVTNAANVLLQAAAATAVGFQRPLHYMGSGPARSESGNWSYSTQGEDSYLVKQLRFGGALRVQKTTNAT